MFCLKNSLDGYRLQTADFSYSKAFYLWLSFFVPFFHCEIKRENANVRLIANEIKIHTKMSVNSQRYCLIKTNFTKVTGNFFFLQNFVWFSSFVVFPFQALPFLSPCWSRQPLWKLPPSSYFWAVSGHSFIPSNVPCYCTSFLTKFSSNNSVNTKSHAL